MEETKPKMNWQRIFITTGFVLASALIVGGTTWYVMDKSAKEIQTANEKTVKELQAQIDGIQKSQRITKTSTSGSDAEMTITDTVPEVNPNSVKGSLKNTYRNDECSYTLNYPDGFKLTNSEARNVIFSSTVFFAVDHGFTASCMAGDATQIKAYNDYSTGTEAMKYVDNSDGSRSYYTVSNGGRLIAIKFSDPNKLYKELETQILATLKLN